MSKCKGKVTALGKSKFSYFVMLDTKDGFYFNTKFEPKCGKDDVVGIDYTSKGENRGNVSKITLLEDSGSPKGVQAKEEFSGGGSSGGGNRQDSIVFQSSRKDALVMIGVLLGAEAFATKGGPDAKRVQIESLLDEITARYFKDASDPLKSDVITSNAVVDDDAGEGDGEKDGWGGDDEDGGDTWDD